MGYSEIYSPESYDIEILFDLLTYIHIHHDTHDCCCNHLDWLYCNELLKGYVIITLEACQLIITYNSCIPTSRKETKLTIARTLRCRSISSAIYYG